MRDGAEDEDEEDVEEWEELGRRWLKPRWRLHEDELDWSGGGKFGAGEP